MDTDFGCKPQTPNLIDLIRKREMGDLSALKLTSKQNVTPDFVARLGLEKELEGHQGCVNCLQWSETGEILASASDDKRILLWNPFSYKKLCSFNTGHSGNIFAVNFMPKCSNNIVVSGAADAMVKVFDLTLSEVLYTCGCHDNRVKGIATAVNTPYMFWSAAEDGLILQHDLRMPRPCVAGRKKVLIDLVHNRGLGAQAKSLAINPMKPELVAVGANDANVRMYDRRMIKLGVLPVETFVLDRAVQTEGVFQIIRYPDGHVPSECAECFVPGHFAAVPKESGILKEYAATSVTFSSDGNELLANIAGEQIYLFDTVNLRLNRLFDTPKKLPPDNEEITQKLLNSAYGTIDSKNSKDYTSMNLRVLPRHVEELKVEANSKFQLKEYSAAINLYNEALGFCPMAAVLYGNRAAALMKRRWDSDIYAALRDCQTTLLLDPGHVKARFRLAQCLFDLNCPHEATRVILDFQEMFPGYALNSAFRDLKQAISTMIEPKDYSETLPSRELALRKPTIDYKLRYCGHCNTTTDIKEANFFGSDGQYIIAGSDDSHIFLWDRYTTNIIKVLTGDSRIVNCLQPHPSSCLLATSGIDSVIRLWSPLPENKRNQIEIINIEEVARMNQIQMHSDPFALMMMDMSHGNFRRNLDSPEENDETEDDNEPVTYHRTCRTS